MPSGSFRQAYVVCPFFKYDDGKRRITCEGLVDNSSLALIYQHKTDYERQISVFCCEHYKNCEVYQMLMTKYEEDNN